MKKPSTKPGVTHNRVRIIGGTHRSRWLAVADAPGLRPTPDRVRETLFNWLGQNLSGQRCLDLFAGSGALAFEAASRGASEVIAVEYDAKVAKKLTEQALALKLEALKIRQGDALQYLRVAPKTPFDVVFLDPPYATDLLQQTIPLLAGWLAPQALIYIESSVPVTFNEYGIIRSGKAGAVHFALIQSINH